ncbi:hypothetical protein ABZ817_10955 [Streptomyces antimycoticus]|uniref:hypothetical protein n=1 Tax=Streptomyces antimycoticus TaxID=68175 RepID=UPI0033C5D2C1
MAAYVRHGRRAHDQADGEEAEGGRGAAAPVRGLDAGGGQAAGAEQDEQRAQRIEPAALTVDGAGGDGAGADGPGADGPGADGPGADGPGADGPVGTGPVRGSSRSPAGHASSTAGD